jgi:hypothetical protein
MTESRSGTILLFSGGVAMCAMATAHSLSRSWPLAAGGILAATWAIASATARGRQILGAKGPVLAGITFLAFCLAIFVWAIPFGLRHHDTIIVVVGIAGIAVFMFRIVYWFCLGGRDKYNDRGRGNR